VTRIDDLLARGAPADEALVHGAERVTYAELSALADAAAARFVHEGVRANDRVALWGPKSVPLVAALFGAWRAGAVAVPVNPVLKPAQVAHILSDSGAALLVAPDERLALMEGALGGARPCPLATSHHGLGHPLPRAGAGPASAASLGEGRADALAAILYTSGSTGRPKGVMLSHRNLLLAADSVAAYQTLGPDDRALAVLPLSFDAGLSVLTSALHAGGTCVLLDYLLPRDVLRVVERERITTLPGVPPLFVQLAEVPWPNRLALRRITVTGGRMPPPLTARLRALAPAADIYLMYGLTEAFRSLYLDPAEVDARPTSVGGPIPYAEVLIVRPDGSPCAPDEPGELVHCGPLVAQGYWRDPERTAERFRPAPPHALHQGPAVWSGDTLRRDADGYHYFVGRRDEQIKTSGLRVSPTEIEEAAVATGAVAEAVAIGVPDERLGEAILLVARAAGGLDHEVAEAQLRAGLAAALPAYMHPRRIAWRAELPRNPNGKIDRAGVRAAVLA
jgi:acyl-CoA ligase (AMP-forming) (exosortase A-associated)